MDQVAPRSDDVTPNTEETFVKPYFKSTNIRSNPAFVTVSRITTCAEITKTDSLPILKPNRPQSFSSMSSFEDNITQLPPCNEKKKSIFQNNNYNNSSDEYASSPGSESDMAMISKSLQKYANSPPAGSGGKFMKKPNRSSWTPVTDSTPSTPISLPETIKLTRSRKSSVIAIDKRFEDNNKSGSIYKLRENRLPSPKIFDENNRIHNRNSSISSILTDNNSIISSEDYESSNDNDSIKCKN